MVKPANFSTIGTSGRSAGLLTPIFAQIAKTDFGFEVKTPIVDAGPILYRMPAMAKPVYDKIEAIIKEKGLN